MSAQPTVVTAADTSLIWPQALPARLPRFVLLAVLLHLWLVLMLGTAPGGTAPKGKGVFGSLNITLQSAPSGPPGSAESAQPPATPTGARGDAEQQRFGGAVRSALPLEPAPAPPGAAQLGDWSPLPGLTPDGQAALHVREPAPEPLREPLRESTPEPTPLPPFVSPPASPAAALAAPLKQITAAPALPAAPQAPLRPSSAAAQVQSPQLASVPLPSATLQAASAERQLAARLAPERAAPGAALPDVVRAPAGPLLGAVPAPSLLAAPLPPSAAPEPALAQLPRLAPATPLSAPLPALAAMPAAAVAAPLPSVQNLVRPGPAPAGATASATTGPVSSPVAATAAAAGQGAADAGSRVGADVATPPSNATSAPKRLNLELPRLRGGELSRYSTTGLLPALPRPPELPDKLGSAIEKTAKDDCRKAYAAAGLLAVVPLAVDALREGGCKW